MPGFGNEYDYYRAIYGDKANIIEANFKDMTIYSHMSRSNLIVSTLSSALNGYGFGKKILYFNYTGTSIYHCDIDHLMSVLTLILL